MGTAAPQLDRESLLALYKSLDETSALIADADHDALTLPELMEIAQLRERVARTQAGVQHAVVAQIVEQATPNVLQGTPLREMLMHTLRISRDDADKRIAKAKDLGPRQAITGEPLAPKLPRTAAAQRRGEIGDGHVKIIRAFFKQLPKWIDCSTREKAEKILASNAAAVGPEELRKIADHLALTLDQDGPEPDDQLRARQRYLHFGKQDSDGMTEVRGRVDPETRAIWDAINAKWAAPGMCNPEDDTPCVDDEPDTGTVDRDTRTSGQRRHDAFKAVGRAMLASGQLGQHNGIPCSIVVTATLQDIESGAGWAVTGGGTVLPMSDVIRLASHAYHYLCLFDTHTEVPLYLGRTKRVASPGQRIVLYARDRGCTKPGCDAPPYWCQVHHRDNDWQDGGHTNIDELTLACQPDHRLLSHKGWTTRTGKDGRTEWIPPPHLDTGQSRVNNYHHPERYLAEDADEEDDDAPP